MNGRAPVEDGGRQFERTAFAWMRTTLGVVIVAVLVARQAALDGRHWLITATVGASLALAVVVLVVRTRALEARTPPFAPSNRVIISLVGALVAIGIVAFALVL